MPDDKAFCLALLNGELTGTVTEQVEAMKRREPVVETSPADEDRQPVADEDRRPIIFIDEFESCPRPVCGEPIAQVETRRQAFNEIYVCFASGDLPESPETLFLAAANSAENLEACRAMRPPTIDCGDRLELDDWNDDDDDFGDDDEEIHALYAEAMAMAGGEDSSASFEELVDWDREDEVPPAPPQTANPFDLLRKLS